VKNIIAALTLSDNRNKRRMLLAGLLLTALLMLSVSCLKKDKFPDTPAIQFVSFTKIQNATGVDNKGILKISFTDGDGDIGLTQGDTLPPFNIGSQWYYNFFITYYERQHGILKKIDLPFTNNSRIPPLSNSGSTKPIKGEIAIELYINNPLSSFDTIAFEAGICDRALNVSNNILTPDIVVKKR